MLSKYPTWCRATFVPCCHDLTCVIVYSSCSIIQMNDVSNHVRSSLRSRSLYPGRRCPLWTSALKEVIFDPEHLTKLLGQEDRVMMHNKQSLEAQLDSTMVSHRPRMKRKVAWVIEEPSSFQTSICPSCYVVNASFIISCAPSFVNLETRFLLRGRAITPHVTVLLITS
jgi:hypothetical protein